MSNLNQNSKLYVLVIGSKGVNDYNLIQKKLDIYLSNYKESKNVELIGCDANGVDRFVEQYAKEHGYTSKIFPISKEEWNEYKASAYWRKIKAMQEYIAEFDNRHCITFFDENSANAKHSLYNMCRLYNTHYVPVNITEDFTEELDFDTDTIEEYEEHVAHYGKVKKHVEAPVLVKKATAKELERIDKILAKRHENINELENAITYLPYGYNELEDYIETKNTMEEEYAKRYRGTKSKICNQIKTEDFSNRMIYTLKYNSFKDNSSFIDTIKFLRDNYEPYEYIIDDYKRIFILEENTLDKDISKFSSRQLQDYTDKINELLSDNVEKIIITEEMLENTFIKNIPQETYYSCSKATSISLNKLYSLCKNNKHIKNAIKFTKKLRNSISNPVVLEEKKIINHSLPVYDALREYYLGIY